MKKITMFITSWCPHCKRALSFMEELKSENPAYNSIDINIVDEEEQPDFAKQFNYYYVPTYFVEEVKAHEGAVTKEIIKNVLDKALA